MPKYYLAFRLRVWLLMLTSPEVVAFDGFELCPITSAATGGVLRNADSVVTARSETPGIGEFLAPGGVRT